MLSVVVFAAVVAILIHHIVKWYKQNKEFCRKLNAFPGPKPLPIIGNALDFINTTDIIPSLMRFIEFHGDIFKVKIMNRYFLIVADPDLMEFVLSSNKLIDKSDEYVLLEHWLGKGLLTSTGSKWKHNRKIITPTFHFNILEQYVSVFNNCGNILIQKLKKEVGNEDTDIYPYITLCTLDAICETAMGLPLNSQNNDNTEYVDAIRKMGKIVINRSTSTYKRNDQLFKLSSDYNVEKKCLEILNKTTEDVVEQRKKYMQEHINEYKNKIDETYGKKRMAFLDMLLQINVNENALTNQDIKDEVATFMFEGHDTTSSAVCFTLYMLSQHPDIQQKVYEEVKEIYGDKEELNASYSELQSMKYLDLVIKETLRLYTTVPVFGRALNEDVEYKGKTIPKGVSFLLFPFGLHRNSKIFPNPNKFDPDRFLTENQTKRPAYGYVPFSAGPRNCVGQKFAMLELKCVLSKVIKTYKLEPSSIEPILSAETIIKSTNGIHVKFLKR